MGKGKKGKKDVEKLETSDGEIENQAAGDASDEEEQEVAKAGKKTKKNNKNKPRAEDSDCEIEVAEKQVSKVTKKVKENVSDDDQFDSRPISSFTNFDMLGGESDDDVGIKSEEEEVASKKTAKKKKKANKKDQDGDDEVPAATGDKKGKKKNKKAKKGGDSDDEDLDKMLAEIQLEYDDVKKPEEQKKNKKKMEEPAPLPVAEPEVETKKKDKKKKKTVTEEVQQVEKPVEVAVEQPVETNPEAAGAGKKKKGPGKAMVLAMQEALKKKKEDDERMEQMEEERIRILEEAEAQREEARLIEQEKKDKKKQKEKEKKERLKAEGKLLTAKQKADMARAQAMLESLKAQGIAIPGDAIEKKIRPGTRIRPSKQKKETVEEVIEVKPAPVEEVKPEVVPEPIEVVTEVIEDVEPEPIEEIPDAWDVSEDEEVSQKTSSDIDSDSKVKAADGSEESEAESGDDGTSDDEDDESDSSEDSDHRTEAEKMRERAIERIQKRELEAENKRTTENLRAAVVCVLGHVDTGKTKILDKLRRTNVQDGEAGGITQQIGATNVPIENIKDNTKHLKSAADFVYKLPGLLIIDTPGHESFSNLRSRGSSLCDIAILVVDIMHGLEPQTIESLNLLKSRKTPFVVALNKIDRLYDWNTMGRKDVHDVIKSQAVHTQQEFEKRTQDTILQFSEQGMNAALFYDNPDPRKYISMVPTSAITGEGMGNLLMLVVQFSQNQLAKRLMYSETLQATVLEVKAIPGLGTTIDVILINGKLREGDTMILAGTEGPIVTQVKALLMPQPMKELRVKNAYVEYKEIIAAQGVKIAAKELEKAIAGINLQIAQKADETEIFKDIVARDLKSILRSIKLSDQGVFVQASTLGSLEALLEFLKTSKIPYAGIRIGPVVKRDVMKASIMLEHQSEYATILAFDVKIERDAQEYADKVGVKIFDADIIYHLFDKFTAYREELKQQKREQFKSIAVFPCKLKILPQFVFNSRDPIVMGVMVEAGIVREGTPICVPSKEFEELGMVTSIESNHKNVPSARKGMEVCIKIEPYPGDTPKMFGRHFDDTDILVSKISRQSIDACKDYFREDLLKSDWALMVDLKKAFGIL